MKTAIDLRFTAVDARLVNQRADDVIARMNEYSGPIAIR